MERLMVLYYIRSGYVRVTAKTIIDAARSAGAIARIKSAGMPILYEPGRRLTGVPFFGVGAVLICPLGRGRADDSSLRSILRPVTFRGMRGLRKPGAPALGSAARTRAAALPPNGSLSDPQPVTGGESTVIVDPRLKELLSAAVANANACQNWLSRAKPNLERARVSIAHVIRDVNDLARMLEGDAAKT
jgi:hypothetical protein